MSRKSRVVPPVMINTGVAVVGNEIVATTQEEFKKTIEREYAPEKKDEPKIRSFYGVGTHLPTICGKSVKISFSSNANNVYKTNNADVINWLVNKGFKEA